MPEYQELHVITATNTNDWTVTPVAPVTPSVPTAPRRPRTPRRRELPSIPGVISTRGCGNMLDAHWICTHHISYRLGIIHVAYNQGGEIGGLRIDRDNEVAYIVEWLNNLYTDIPRAITEFLNHQSEFNPPMDEKMVGALNNLCKIIEESDTHGVPPASVI